MDSKFKVGEVAFYAISTAVIHDFRPVRIVKVYKNGRIDYRTTYQGEDLPDGLDKIFSISSDNQNKEYPFGVVNGQILTKAEAIKILENSALKEKGVASE